MKRSTKPFIEKLSGLGCRFAVDGFGSGLSAFAHLRYLPVDFIKIDSEFVRKSILDPLSLETVNAIHRLSRTLHIQTIAKDAEDEGVLQLLRQLGVDYAQGIG